MNKLSASQTLQVAVAFSDPKLPLAVVVARTRWDEPPRTRHDIARQLIRFCNVIFVEFFPMETSHHVSEWRKVGNRLLVYAPHLMFPFPGQLYANDPITHKLVNLRWKRRLLRAVQSFAAKTVLLFNFKHDFPEIMKTRAFAWRGYVCVDEFSLMVNSDRDHSRLKRAYQARLNQYYEDRVALRANRCFTPHYALRDKLKRVNPRVNMLFHASDVSPRTSVEAVSSRKEHLQVGLLAHLDWRLLEDWLLALVQQPDMVLHMIGPVVKQFSRELRDGTNVRWWGVLPDDALMQKFQEMDVLIMPYNPRLPVVAAMTTNCKTFQYISACKPVVISNLPNYIKLPEGVIYKAATAGEFVSQIRRAHAEDCLEYINLRAEIARSNTWNMRGDMVFDAVAEDLGYDLRSSRLACGGGVAGPAVC